MQRRLMVLSLAGALMLAGCSESRKTPTVPVVADHFKVILVAEGELKAAQATPITVPRLPGAQILSWFQDANTEVKEGDVVARFDPTNFRLELNDAQTELDKLSLQDQDLRRELTSALVALGHDQDEVEYELDMANRFNVDNPLLYSRLEMIDSARDEAYLGAQQEFYGVKEGRYEEKAGAERSVLETQRSVQAAKLQRNEGSLARLEVRAPHDGLFIPEKNWVGEPPRVGQSVFPGSRLASLPDLSEMHAVVFVPEKEAVGLKDGLAANIVVDAFPERPMTGTVLSVSKTAQSRSRNNPVKFFTVTLALERSEPEWMLPGRRVTVEIIAADVPDALALPNQAIFQEGDSAWVYRGDGSDFERVPVTLGVRGSARSQVVAGVDAGDVVALIEPAQLSMRNGEDA
ncbi:MAG: efflux RND transporter periplasmic adaptor subunit [Pseudomonadota bacterium]